EGGPRGVRHGRGRMGGDAGPGAWSPGNDRVEPAGAGVAADHVRSAADNGRGLVGARRRQPTRRRGAARTRIDTDDRVELADTVAAAEQVDRTADRGGGAVVQGGRESAVAASSGRAGDEGRVGGG